MLKESNYLFFSFLLPSCKVVLKIFMFKWNAVIAWWWLGIWIGNFYTHKTWMIIFMAAWKIVIIKFLNNKILQESQTTRHAALTWNYESDALVCYELIMKFTASSKSAARTVTQSIWTIMWTWCSYCCFIT